MKPWKVRLASGIGLILGVAGIWWAIRQPIGGRLPPPYYYITIPLENLIPFVSVGLIVVSSVVLAYSFLRNGTTTRGGTP
jgi:hypothetical protein